MRALRRIMLTTDTVGGVWVYALELAAILAARDVAVSLVTLGPGPSPAQRAAVADIHGVALHVTDLPLEWLVATPDDLAATSVALASLARAERVDAVQLHSPALVGTAHWPVPVLAVLHSCVGTWWRAMREGPPPDDFAWRIAAVAAGLERADAIVAPSEALATLAGEVYLSNRPIQVIHNGRAQSPHPAPVSREGVIAAGRLWDEAKNIVTLDRAAALLPDVTVAAAGPLTGPNGTFITLHTITPLGGLGPSAMAEALRNARIFASPARYEPFGLAVLEAAAAGCALVLSDLPTFRELWDGAALFLPPDKPAIWAETLAALHGDPIRCHTRGEAARARAAQYSIDAFGDALIETLAGLISPNRAARAA